MKGSTRWSASSSTLGPGRLGYLAPAAALFLAAGMSSAALAADPAPGQLDVCAGCHGPSGVSEASGVPNLAGQKERYLVSALKAYRDGGRNNPLMRSQAKDLTDQEIEALAAHYSRLKPQ